MTRFCGAVFVMLITELAVAQESGGRPVPFQPPGGCKAGRTLVTGCRTYRITEAAYFVRVPTGGDGLDRANRAATVDLGVMHNISSRVGLGVAGSVGLANEFHLVVKPRARFWLGPTTSLDLAPGLVLSGSPRFVAETSIMYRDKIGFSLFGLSNLEYRIENGLAVQRNRFDLYAGIRLGSKPGLFGIAGDALAFLVAIGAVLIACGNNGCD